MAYAIAPAIAPTVSVMTLLIVGACASLGGPPINPASLVILLPLVLTAGMAASYAVAGVIGMPIAFWLRRKHMLNANTIYFAAFVAAGALALLGTLLLSQGNFGAMPLGLVYMFMGVAPPVLVAAFVFSSIIRSGFGSKCDANRASGGKVASSSPQND